MFTFLHAADLHLDSPLRGLDQYEGAPVDAIRGATRRAFSKLVQLALDEHVAFVILVGDCFDGDWPDYNSGLFFANELRRLELAGIPVMLLRGNHDAESRITVRLSYPSNVHEFSIEQAETIRLENLRVALHGQGFAHQAETRNLAADYPSPLAGWFNIGVLHTALEGREGHGTYAPCSVQQLVARGYDYWALGHVHQRESVNGDGRVRIEFPGNIQGRHVRETGPKGGLLVSVDDARRVEVEFRPLDVFRWEVLEIRPPGDAGLLDVVDRTVSAIRECRDETGGQPLAARVIIRCDAELQTELAEQLDRLRAELARHVDGEGIWIEKVRVRRADDATPAAIEITGDAASEVRATLAELQDDPEAVRQLLTSGECDGLRKKLPAELQGVLKGEALDEVFELAAMFLAGTGTQEEPA